jgi:Trp operon repressor
VKKRVSIGQYQIYDLCVNKELPAREVAATLEISIARVYLAKHRVGVQFKKAIREVAKIRNRDEGR